MKHGDLLTGTITRFDTKGRGVFFLPREDGTLRMIAVPTTTIGDVVEARFIKRRQGVIQAELARVVTPGLSRVPVAAGLEKYPALWLSIAYDAQVRFKQEQIDEAFKDAGHSEHLERITPSSITAHYRNRMDYGVGWNGTIGLKEFGSWSRVHNVTNDPLFSKDAEAILNVFRRLIDSTAPGPHLQPWDAKKETGDLRNVVIREGKATGERLVMPLVKDLSCVTDDVRALLRDALDPYATAIVLGEQPSASDISSAETIVPLKGSEIIRDIVNGTAYDIHVNSFFQTNPVMAAMLQDIVAETVRATRPTRVLDLYCGLGFFAINLAQRFPDITVAGFEIDAQAIHLATRNAATNGVAEQCTFTSGPAEDLSWKDTDANLVIVDPPRAGLHPRVLKTLLEKKPTTIIYVSCNYHRLAQELTQLKTAYKVESLQAVDLFPHTPHVEVVAVLTRMS